MLRERQPIVRLISTRWVRLRYFRMGGIALVLSVGRVTGWRVQASLQRKRREAA